MYCLISLIHYVRERKKRKKIMKNETKLKKLEAWLDENNFSHHVPRSLERGVKGSPNLIITPFGNHRINVKIEGDDDSLFYDLHRGKHPVFIRDSETPKFVLEKVQNVIIELMKKENAFTQLTPEERRKVEKKREKNRKKNLRRRQKCNASNNGI